MVDDRAGMDVPERDELSFPRSLPDLMGLFVWILARVVPPKLAEQLDGGGHIVVSMRATFPPWRKQRPEQTSGPFFQLGIGHEERSVLAPQFSGKAGDFLSQGSRQGWRG